MLSDAALEAGLAASGFVTGAGKHASLANNAFGRRQSTVATTSLSAVRSPDLDGFKPSRLELRLIGDLEQQYVRRGRKLRRNPVVGTKRRYNTCDSNSPSTTRVRIFDFGRAALAVRITLPAASVVML